tara:strand:+ start:3340 stop:3564 length:225 start_codon:yes stop_codon:yes gene_type:complete
MTLKEQRELALKMLDKKYKWKENNWFQVTVFVCKTVKCDPEDLVVIQVKYDDGKKYIWELNKFLSEWSEIKDKQ